MRFVFILLHVLFISAAVFAAEPKHATTKKVLDNKAKKVEQVLPEAWVTLDDKPLFAIKSRVLSYTPKERAKLISSRLSALSENPLFRPESLEVVDGDGLSDIIAADKILMSVSESDANAMETTHQLLAREFAEIIRTALEQHNKEYSINNIIMGALYACVATFVLIIAIYLVRRLFKRLMVVVHSWRGRYIRPIRIYSFELLRQERAELFISVLLGSLRTTLLLGLFYLYISLVLGFFPWTRGISKTLFDHLLILLGKGAGAIVFYLPNVFFLFVIVVIARYAIRVMRFLFSAIEKETIYIPGFYQEWANSSFQIVRFIIIAFSLVMAFPYLPGSDSPAFKGMSVFIGVLLSLGSTSVVANITSGIILTYMRPFRLGDRVKIADTEGDVIERDLLVTRIRTVKNVDITIPSTMVLQSHIINYSSSAFHQGLILNTTVTFGYDMAWPQAHELLISAAQATENILTDPGPFVLQTAFNDFSVSYEINAYTDKPSVMARTYSDLRRNIQDKCREAGVEMISPHYMSLQGENINVVSGQRSGKNHGSPESQS